MKILMFLSNPLMVDPSVHKKTKVLTDVGHEIAVVTLGRRSMNLKVTLTVRRLS